MVKIMKSQKVVIILAGRYAGRKAVVVKVHISHSLLSQNRSSLVRHTMKVAMNVVMVTLLSLVLLVIHVK